MTKKEQPVRFCRFWVDGHTYSGKLRGQSVDIVEGDPFSGFSSIRISYPIERVKFLAPFTPKKIWAIGLNYKDHANESHFEIPAEPLVFMKSVTALTGPTDFIRIPDWAGAIHYEGELAVAIGKGGRNIPEDEALDHVIGYSVINDVTARELQKKDGQWTRSKSFDTFAPFGPALLMVREMPQETYIHTSVNGKIVQDAKISQMIFPISRLISHISHFATLEAGDIIATGTPSGVGPIRTGDIVEVDIEGIGKLRNICAA